MTAILKIGSIEIPTRAGLDLEQTYEPIGGEITLRTIDGSGIRQQTWKKTRTTISGGGWTPPGIATLDTASSISIACIVPRAIACNASRQATLPTARRTDSGHTPWAIALMADGGTVQTPVTIATNTATADAVTNAIGYQVLYFPLLSCWVDRPSESGQRGEASYRWEITAEEV
jgi:hypothetical protein